MYYLRLEMGIFVNSFDLPFLDSTRRYKELNLKIKTLKNLNCGVVGKTVETSRFLSDIFEYK